MREIEDDDEGRGRRRLPVGRLPYGFLPQGGFFSRIVFGQMKTPSDLPSFILPSFPNFSLLPSSFCLSGRPLPEWELRARTF
jgi:hypothetical protein